MTFSLWEAVSSRQNPSFVDQCSSTEILTDCQVSHKWPIQSVGFVSSNDSTGVCYAFTTGFFFVTFAAFFLRILEVPKPIFIGGACLTANSTKKISAVLFAATKRVLAVVWNRAFVDITARAIRIQLETFFTLTVGIIVGIKQTLVRTS